MIFFLILGIALGAVAVLFVLQNMAVVSVSFFALHMEGSMALVLFMAIVTGLIIALLLVLPSLINDAYSLGVLRKQNKKLVDELASSKEALAKVTAHLETTT